MSEALDQSETEAAIRAAQAELDRAEQLARLDNDPTTQTLLALRVFLGSTAAITADQRRAMAEHSLHVDRDFSAVRQARDGLAQTIDQAFKAAKAQAEAAHADLSRQFVASFAQAAEQRLKGMSRWVWWRTLASCAALAIVILALGFGLGYWRGNAAGYSQAAGTIHATGAVGQSVLASQGPAGLAQWHQLMRDNAIIDTMKSDCTGKNVAHQDGRTACHLWLWTTPNVASAAHG
ncbi:hypothetical protein SAMN02746095_02399 [Acidocella aminolytica 101 = DSM 11237]|uniref:hypothetical protein n=1 Tax=Acidocella aminolytica TaxID=33998 RepID=UPI0009237C01|nr:hypothetical protein [Acidocella aminolytica]SHF19026.1 hypothetical protein SAMN02746095_02399 [Acidocella aminolytica 101 = DSM 11237]